MSNSTPNNSIFLSILQTIKHKSNSIKFSKIIFTFSLRNFGHRGFTNNIIFQAWFSHHKSLIPNQITWNKIKIILNIPHGEFGQWWVMEEHEFFLFAFHAKHHQTTKNTRITCFLTKFIIKFSLLRFDQHTILHDILWFNHGKCKRMYGKGRSQVKIKKFYLWLLDYLKSTNFLLNFHPRVLVLSFLPLFLLWPAIIKRNGLILC